MKADPRLSRIDSCRVAIANRHGIDATLFANTEVPVELAAVDELVTMLDLAETVDRFASLEPESFDVPPEIEKVAVTPDFHKAGGIPVGTILATRGFMVPQAIGNDINCGMRLHTTGLSVETVKSRLDELEHRLRHVFFTGGRNLPMTRLQREALLRDGLGGLVESTPRGCDEGLWRCFHDAEVGASLGRVDQLGSLKANGTPGMESYLGSERDRAVRDQVTGCVGGGNHFVELQYVEKIHDGAAAHAWGLKAGMVTVMIHSGSVAIGHITGDLCRQALRQMYPGGLAHPANGIFILPQSQRNTGVTERFWDALHNAANFAFGNRLFLSLMAWSAMREVLGEFDLPLLYDAPHNLLWREGEDPDARIVHRKGACPARGFEAMAGTEFECYGQPVMVPGSMGASSYIMAGRGLEDSLSSASHGAGRVLSRGEAAHGFEAEFAAFMRNFRVVTPADLRRPDIALRRDVVDKKLQALREEAPYAFKGIAPIIETLQDAGIAQVVAELRPIMTVKG